MFRKESLDRLSALEELDELMTVTSPRGWLALLALGGLLAALVVWALSASIVTTVGGRGMLVAGPAGDLSATLYVSIDEARELRQGMPVQLELAAVRREEHGLLLGSVSQAGELPANQAEMLAVLGNDAYATSLAAAGLLVPVEVSLVRQLETATGYQWTSPLGPIMNLTPGMTLRGSVVVSDQQVISLIVP